MASPAKKDNSVFPYRPLENIPTFFLIQSLNQTHSAQSRQTHYSNGSAVEIPKNIAAGDHRLLTVDEVSPKRFVSGNHSLDGEMLTDTSMILLSQGETDRVVAKITKPRNERITIEKRKGLPFQQVGENAITTGMFSRNKDRLSCRHRLQDDVGHPLPSRRKN